MATTASKKSTKRPAAATIKAKASKAVAKSVKGKRNIGGIISAIIAPVAIVAIGYGLTKLDARLGGKVMGMVLNR